MWSGTNLLVFLVLVKISVSKQYAKITGQIQLKSLMWGMNWPHMPEISVNIKAMGYS